MAANERDKKVMQGAKYAQLFYNQVQGTAQTYTSVEEVWDLPNARGMTYNNLVENNVLLDTTYR